LVGKRRYQGRSQREIERLQSQISCYALRINLERDADELRKARLRLENPLPEPSMARGMDTFIELCLTLVESVVPCPKCTRVASHELGCTELAS
jgi:hypothetical protein